MAAESLAKVREALARTAPTIKSAQRCCSERDFDPAMVFRGKRLTYLVVECLDGYLELFAVSGGAALLKHESWHVVAKIVTLLESNGISSLQSSEPIELRNRHGVIDTVIASTQD